MRKFTQNIRDMQCNDKFPVLNLPASPQRIEMRGGMLCIYDNCRLSWVKLTPEEWVRQHFTAYLSDVLGYPRGIIGNEVSLRLNNTARRADTIIYDCHGEPYIIVEYKAPNIEITQEVFNQILRYNLVLRAPYLAVSNGLRHYFCAIDHTSGAHRFIKELPHYCAGS